MKLTTGYKKPIDSSILVLLSDGSHKNISDIINSFGAMSISPAWTFSSPISGDLLGNASTADRLKNARTINGVSFDGSGNITITAAPTGYYQKYPYGFSSFTSGVSWGNTTGTSFASWNDSTGGSIDFRRDNPSSGKMSVKVDGYFYLEEGAYRCLDTNDVSGGGSTWGDSITVNGTTLTIPSLPTSVSGSSGSCTGNAASATYASYLPTKYNGGDLSNPQTYFSSSIGLRVAMTRYSAITDTTAWYDTLWINGYSGSDVPNMVALHTIRNGTPRLFLSSLADTATSYGTYYEVLSTYNESSHVVTLIGALTIAGNKTFSGTTSIDTLTAGNLTVSGATTLTGNVSTGALNASSLTLNNTAVILEGDSRLTNSRTPNSHTHGNITNAGAIGSTATLPIITTTNGVLTTGSFGTTAGTFCLGNDSRLSDSRAASTIGGSTWAPGTNITLTATENSQEWSFDIYRNSKTGCYWHVWDSSLGTMLKVNADDGVVSAPYGFSGALTGNVTGNCSGSSGSCTGNAATATNSSYAYKIKPTSFYGTTPDKIILVDSSTNYGITLIGYTGLFSQSTYNSQTLAGGQYGFPASNNANAIIYIGTHPGNTTAGNCYGWQLGFSSNGYLYARNASNSTFTGSWNRIAWLSEIPTITGSLTTSSSANGGSNVWTFYNNGTSIGTLTVKNGGLGSTGTRGSRFSTGTGITRSGSTVTSTSSGITDALVNDLYLNTSTYDIYKCTTAGNASAAVWAYQCNIKGALGSSTASTISWTEKSDNADYIVALKGSSNTIYYDSSGITYNPSTNVLTINGKILTARDSTKEWTHTSNNSYLSFELFDSTLSTAPTGYPLAYSVGFQINGYYGLGLAAYGGSDTFYIRRNDLGWKKLIHSGNIGSQSVNYATSAGSTDYTTRLASTAVSNKGGLNYYYLGGSTSSNDATGSYSGYSSSTTYNSVLRLLSHTTAGALYYVDLIFDVNSNNIGYRRVTNSGTPSLNKLAFETMANNTSIKWENTSGTAYSILVLNSSNVLGFGWATREVGYKTQIHGSSLEFCVNTSSSDTTSLKALDLAVGGAATFSGSVYTNSDIRYKTNIQDLNLVSENIASLPIFKYTWNDKHHNDKINVGSSAQSVEQIIPELVTENEEGFKSLDYATLGSIGSVIACREIEKLKNRIKELEDKLNGIYNSN